jgi:hypothetical protein
MAKTYHIGIVHVVEFNDCIEVQADSEEEAVEKAKAAFVEKPEQSELVEVYVADVEEVGACAAGCSARYGWPEARSGPGPRVSF